MPRFVLLEHHFNGVHWDFMLENGESLLTWEFTAPPAPATPTLIRKKPDHRLLYLDYEGDISGDRGHVHRRDSGNFEWVTRAGDAFSITLFGKIISGVAEFRKKDTEIWTFLWRAT